MYLSHGSAWIPRVVPAASLNEIFCCTGPKSGIPAAIIFSRCQFSLNHAAVVAVDGQLPRSSSPEWG